MNDPALLVAVFLFAGFVKGVTGLGLPTLSIAILAPIIGLTEAITLSLLPGLASNAWQAVNGPALLTLIGRYWAFFAGATVTVWMGTLAFNFVAVGTLTLLLGLVLAGYSIRALCSGYRVLSHDTQRWLLPSGGIVNGLISGLTGTYLVPGVFLIQSAGLNREEQIQAMGILFTLSSLASLISLRNLGMASETELFDSALAMIPVFVGLLVGIQLRPNLAEMKFKIATLSCLFGSGIYLIVSSMV